MNKGYIQLNAVIPQKRVEFEGDIVEEHGFVSLMKDDRNDEKQHTFLIPVDKILFIEYWEE